MRKEELAKRIEENIKYRGPRKLEKIIHDKRTNGVLLPFTVDVYRGRASILTKWDNSSENNGENGESGENGDNDSSHNTKNSFDKSNNYHNNKLQNP